MENTALMTDLYQLTMSAAYKDNGKDGRATFDLFIRKMPEDWGYFIANGVEDALDFLAKLRFRRRDVDFLRGLDMFEEEFLDSLEGFRFKGDVAAVREGTPVFPNEPMLRVEGNRVEAQFVESALLNTVNFQTMIASKASRIVNAAGRSTVVDFGLRRAQGADAAMKGARAAFLAGAVATSNVEAGRVYGIPVVGTQAHSFVMSFDDERKAFRAYAKTFPDGPTLLIDTYDTLMGAQNAATVGRELDGRGLRLGAVRLDSGDLAALSKSVRWILDDSRLEHVRILASNDLNEYKIEELRNKGAPIDGYGVGTEMITAKPVAAISGVYKLVEDEGGSKMKFSDGKMTLPGRKQVFRQPGRDAIGLEGEDIKGIPLLERAMESGKRKRRRPRLVDSREYCLEQVASLPDRLKRTRVAKPYEVGLSPGLKALIDRLTKQRRCEDG